MLTAKCLTKVFGTKNSTESVVDDVSFSLPNNGLICITGQSGSGKTTLLSLLSGLLTPTKGEILFNGEPLNRENCSSVVAPLFQQHNLVEDMSCEANLSIIVQDKKRIDLLLEKLGLKGKGKRKASTLSGGEKKRLAIVRNLLMDTPVLTLDEPTANLDGDNASLVFSLLKEISREKLIVVVTHDEKQAGANADMLFQMSHGKLVLLSKKETAVSQSETGNFSVAKRRKPNPRFFFRFAQKTIWRKPGKTIGSATLSCFSFLLATLLSTLSFFRLQDSLGNIFQESGASFIPISLKQESDVAIESFKAAKKVFPDLLPCVSFVEKNADISLYAFPYEEGMKIQGRSVESPKSGSCYTTSFVQYVSKGSISLMDGDSSLKWSTNSIVESPNLDQVIDWYQESRGDWKYNASSTEFFHFSQQPDYLQEYGFAIFNEEDFWEKIAAKSSYLISGSDFLLPYSIENETYISKELSYSPYQGQELLSGRKPEKENEIVVSQAYLESVNVFYPDSEPSSFLSKTFYYRDLSSSLIKPRIRMDLLFPSVTIAGIVADSSSSVYSYQSDYQKIVEENLYASRLYYSLNNNPKQIAEELKNHKQNYTTSFMGTSPSYFLDSSKSSPIYPFLIAGTALLLLLSGFYTMMICTENVSDRKREIALFESLGITKTEINGNFLFQNGMLGLSSFTIAVAIAYPALAIINSILKSPDVFNVPYDVLVISPWTIAIGFACFLFVTVFSTILPLIRIGKIDILEVLKKN